MKDYFGKVGEIDHLVWTSGDGIVIGFSDIDIANSKGESSCLSHLRC